MRHPQVATSVLRAVFPYLLENFIEEHLWPQLAKDEGDFLPLLGAFIEADVQGVDRRFHFLLFGRVSREAGSGPFFT